MVHPSLHIFNDQLHHFIHTDFDIEILSDNCQFTEGPVWNPQGWYLFSDIPANCIFQIDALKNKKIYLAESGTNTTSDEDINPQQAGSNGLAYDRTGNLVICQHGSHALAVYDGAKLEQLTGNYNNKPYNSPNDLIFHSDGRLFFSDPPYGLRDGQLNPAKFQDKAGVFCFNHGAVEMISDRYAYPNGVCLSPDERVLYICSNKNFEAFISRYDTVNHLLLDDFAEENSDGISCDRAGNVYLCNKDGIIILDNKGKRAGWIQLPAIPANICWGGDEGNDLLICARQYILLIRGLQR